MRPSYSGSSDAPMTSRCYERCLVVAPRYTFELDFRPLQAPAITREVCNRLGSTLPCPSRRYVRRIVHAAHEVSGAAHWEFSLGPAPSYIWSVTL